MLNSTQTRELNYNLFRLETTENIHEELYYVNEIKRIIEDIERKLEERISRQKECDKIFIADEEEIRKNYEYYRKRVQEENVNE